MDQREHCGSITELDGLSTEELAQRGLARMNDGAYMAVIMLDGGGINMMPYQPNTVIQVRRVPPAGNPRGDPRLPTAMEELGNEMIKELSINTLAILKKVRARDGG